MMVFDLSATKAIFRARKNMYIVFILIQNSDNDDGKTERKRKNRKPFVSLYDMPGIHWTSSILGPTQDICNP